MQRAAAMAMLATQVKRTAYETLQNVADQPCGKDPGAECRERRSYDEYRDSRDTLE